MKTPIPTAASPTAASPTAATNLKTNEKVATTDAAKAVLYCLSVAKEFDARLNRIHAFIPDKTASGSANESIIRHFLTTHAPSDFDVAQGFVCDPRTGTVSSQCDVLVYNQSYFPRVYEEGDIKIVGFVA